MWYIVQTATTASNASWRRSGRRNTTGERSWRSRLISQERLKLVQETMMRLTISIPFGIINLPVKSSTVSVTNLTQWVGWQLQEVKGTRKLLVFPKCFYHFRLRGRAKKIELWILGKRTPKQQAERQCKLMWGKLELIKPIKLTKKTNQDKPNPGLVLDSNNGCSRPFQEGNQDSKLPR